MSHWTYNKASGSYRLEIPTVGFLGLVQRQGKEWQATFFRAGARQESPLYRRLADAQACVEGRMKLLLHLALVVLEESPPKKEPHR